MLKLKHLSKEEIKEVCMGERCPREKCDSKEIELIGINPSLDSANCQYRCKKCKQEWEGY